MRYLILLILMGCSAKNICVGGKMYFCGENLESDCYLVYETIARSKPQTCVPRNKDK